jgi:hypothetical protein
MAKRRDSRLKYAGHESEELWVDVGSTSTNNFINGDVINSDVINGDV